MDIETLAEKVEKLEENNRNAHTDLYDKIGELKERLSQDSYKRGKTEEKIDNIVRTLGEIKADLNQLKAKPSRRWDLVINTIISTVIGAICMAIAGGIVK